MIVSRAPRKLEYDSPKDEELNHSQHHHRPEAQRPIVDEARGATAEAGYLLDPVEGDQVDDDDMEVDDKVNNILIQENNNEI